MVTPKKEEKKRQNPWESKCNRVTNVWLQGGYTFFCNHTSALGRVRRNTVTKKMVTLRKNRNFWLQQRKKAPKKSELVFYRVL